MTPARDTPTTGAATPAAGAVPSVDVTEDTASDAPSPALDDAGPTAVDLLPATDQPRLVGLDAFRGAVLALMLLTPVTGEGGSYPLLAHAEWEGFTVSDAILPAFLVTSGASLALLLRPPVTAATRLRLVRRLLALLILGWLYNAIGGPLDVTQVRVTGVLQIIGLSGALAAVVVLAVRRVSASLIPIAVVAVGLPLAYGISLAGMAGPCPGGLRRCNPWHAVDIHVLGADRVYGRGTLGHDPEGLAVVVTATGLVLLGVLAMEWVKARGVGWRPLLVLGVAGAVLIAAGLALDGVQPISKRLHTPAFTFLAGGIGVLGLSLATALWDAGGHAASGRMAYLGRELLAHPLVTLGRNALVVYLAERLLLVISTTTTLATSRGEQTLQQVLVDDLLPVAGVRVHLAHTALLLAAVLAITYVMRALRWRIAL
ncbi:MAG TPA: heparan-alpha-glucosaminide N-acetyltransferase domain-containing protein [Euzebya sp.]|nr:heparan-alpha-glucosaminide N-acetyltransferase domain-containing protein [Euzebya sp.]